MTYRELLLQAEFKLDHNDITLGEFEQMIAPLNREVGVLDKIRAEIEQITDTMGVSYNQYVSKIDVLQIIDKYKAEGSNKK